MVTNLDEPLIYSAVKISLAFNKIIMPRLRSVIAEKKSG